VRLFAAEAPASDAERLAGPRDLTGSTQEAMVEPDLDIAADGTFIADNLLAKHDENYVPREMKDMTAAQAKQTVADTQ
jgi:cytochrome c-type biogenesis protein CcmE